MAGGGDNATRPLEYTPTYTVAAICTFYVVSSLFAERGLHHLSKWLSKKKRKSLYDALEKIKEELMLLGFISLLLAITADYISTFCVKSSFYESQPSPCKRLDAHPIITPSSQSTGHQGTIYVRKVLDDAGEQGFMSSTRHLLETAPFAIGKSCPAGKEPFITLHSLEQLHRFIFIMATAHILYSCLTILLALVKVLKWRVWEDEAHSDTHDNITEMTRTLTMKRQSTFVSYIETSKPWSKNMLVVWVVCFFRQFGQSVTRADYLSLRLGFISRHHTSTKYNFHDYMVRSMEDEFKEIVGVSFSLWIFVVAFMLFNVDGLYLYFWISFIPVGLILIVGMKLQHVIATLAIENTGIRGQYVRPRDELFWFNKPELLLSLINFISFQNAFEMATFIWAVWQFGFGSCFLKERAYVYARLLTGILVQFFCSYSTLPLYSLVTQMGSSYKKAIFPENVVQSLHGWHKAAKHKVKHGGATSEDSASKNLEGSVSIGEHQIDHLPTITDDVEEDIAEVGRSPANVKKSNAHFRTVSPKELIKSNSTRS
ncbi:hypothetical protein O6H91_20G020000 [Diphasiastrum complanatum]|uniref:Uncharacterized protein n=3 Tax=Diphasiastrum complanatum TaxID=34168 RepID=A0ACC2AN64_DIPCM|nr:hypothetical protein O6H91_20G020000 [Diphasiastrum complanatum]KAJ7519027.1 hypothetical protein O6H91_20G020000 [Diphasiastrum complanatum]KAJ7519028.1 hypothetical protein O6H91_20G020000 [Diphasiastrum complanatum]